ncbi:type II pantothenate kinase [Oceanobacillus rekensis]|uniref:type II pantothenate kinase n=1 Tax=Oceanobacillus rekensis TaxID=937927 RepID=UPI000B43BE15|nr:type II pantothenate kinase [Oceanobacillus rekensis]
MRLIGIDAGGSLIKIAYVERDILHVKTYPNLETEKLLQWLKSVAPEATLRVTGGKSGQLATVATQKCRQIDEFQALVEGTRYLLDLEKHSPSAEYIVVNVGTGTSIFHVTPTSFERLSGSGVGGGTLMGLGSLITGEKDFLKLLELAAKGNHNNSDLLVKDIYAPDDAPIFGELTASNFGKANYNENANAADHMAALMQLIGETLILLAGQAALAKNVKKIIFIGSTLDGNKTLQHVLTSFQDRIPYEPVFLSSGAYAGAIGALLL